MRLRTFTVSLAIAAAATLPLAGVALAQPGDRNCEDFDSQQEAQEALLPGDPDNLDDDNDGEACENYDYDSATPSTDPVDEAPEDDEQTSAPEPTESADDDADDETARPTPDAEDDKDDDSQVAVVPRGGVDTGDGTSGAEPAPFLIGGVLALGVAAAATRRRAHTAR